jgi:hypothetical protein
MLRTRAFPTWQSKAAFPLRRRVPSHLPTKPKSVVRRGGSELPKRVTLMGKPPRCATASAAFTRSLRTDRSGPRASWTEIHSNRPGFARTERISCASPRRSTAANCRRASSLPALPLPQSRRLAPGREGFAATWSSSPPHADRPRLSNAIRPTDSFSRITHVRSYSPWQSDAHCSPHLRLHLRVTASA